MSGNDWWSRYVLIVKWQKSAREADDWISESKLFQSMDATTGNERRWPPQTDSSQTICSLDTKIIICTLSGPKFGQRNDQSMWAERKTERAENRLERSGAGSRMSGNGAVSGSPVYGVERWAGNFAAPIRSAHTLATTPLALDIIAKPLVYKQPADTFGLGLGLCGQFTVSHLVTNGGKSFVAI